MAAGGYAPEQPAGYRGNSTWLTLTVYMAANVRFIAAIARWASAVASLLPLPRARHERSK